MANLKIKLDCKEWFNLLILLKQVLNNDFLSLDNNEKLKHGLIIGWFNLAPPPTPPSNEDQYPYIWFRLEKGGGRVCIFILQTNSVFVPEMKQGSN